MRETLAPLQMLAWPARHETNDQSSEGMIFYFREMACPRMRNVGRTIKLLLDMSEDPSLRLHESEVSALRRLAVEIVVLASWREYADTIPPQYLHIFAEVARRRSSELLELAEQLGQQRAGFGRD